MKKSLRIDKFLKSEPKDDPKWVRVVHAVRAAMREEELTTGSKGYSDAAARKIMEDRHLKADVVYV